MFYEKPYVLTLKEEFLSQLCSWCLKGTSNLCPSCGHVVYCNEICQTKDALYHKVECQFYSNEINRKGTLDLVLVRMLIRVKLRLEFDQGEAKEELLFGVDPSIKRRKWSQLFSHRDEILQSDRHRNLWLTSKSLIDRYFNDEFRDLDLLEIFGKILINRFRVGIHQNLSDGRLSIGWSIYLTLSGLNHSCQPDLDQCSVDRKIRLRFRDPNQSINLTNESFNKLTVSYRHQNDFLLTNEPRTFVPRRDQRQKFLKFFFFTCHCSYCHDDARVQAEENSSRILCSSCSSKLILRKDFLDENKNRWILVCRNSRPCHLFDRVQARAELNFDFDVNLSIDQCFHRLESIESLLDPNSILLIQFKEKLLQRFLFAGNFRPIDELKLDRLIGIGDDLVQFYDSYFVGTSIYPRKFLFDLCRLKNQRQNRVRDEQMIEKVVRLWTDDYPTCFPENFFQELSEMLNE